MSQAFSRCSNLKISILSDVANPWESLISALFNDLKISDLNATDREIRYLKL